MRDMGTLWSFIYEAFPLNIGLLNRVFEKVYCSSEVWLAFAKLYPVVGIVREPSIRSLITSPSSLKRQAGSGGGLAVLGVPILH